MADRGDHWVGGSTPCARGRLLDAVQRQGSLFRSAAASSLYRHLRPVGVRRELDTTDVSGVKKVGAVEFAAFSYFWMIMIVSAVSATGGLKMTAIRRGRAWKARIRQYRDLVGTWISVRQHMAAP